MIHSEMHTWTIYFCKETFDDRHGDLQAEADLFSQHWPTTRINVNIMGRVRISHADKRIAEGAAKMFQNAVARHTWWKELHV